jgi:hypothetical protein
MPSISPLAPHAAHGKPDVPFPFHKTHVHPRQKAPDPAPAFFWPLVSFLLSISVSLLCWAAYNALPQKAAGGEKHLQQALLSSKFNPTSAAARRVDIPELLPEPALDRPAAIAKVSGEPPLLPQPAVAMAMPWPITPETPPNLPKAELAPVLEALPPPPLVPPLLPPSADLLPAGLTVAPVVPDQVADVSPLVYRELTPGDTPMLRNWKTLALCSLLTTTVFVQVPAPAAADEKAVLERIDSLQKTIKDSFDGVQVDIKGLKAGLGSQKDDLQKVKDDSALQGLGLNKIAAKVKDIETTLEQIRLDLEALRKREPYSDKAPTDRAGLEDIRTKLGSIESALLKLQPSTSRTSMSPSLPASTGRVVLVNLYPEELLFRINDKNYRVGPGTNLPVENVPAGNLTYEVISGFYGLLKHSTSPLAANETFTLTAR